SVAINARRARRATRYRLLKFGASSRIDNPARPPSIAPSERPVPTPFSFHSMNAKSLSVLLTALLAFLPAVRAQDDNAAARAEMLKALQSLKFQHGQITLQDGLATIDVPKEFSFLGHDDTRTVLEKIWGNPPDDDVLGMLLPADVNLLSTNCWVVTISYSNEGYVKDDDAGKIDYADLLKKMQKASVSENKTRRKQGYPTVEL